MLTDIIHLLADRVSHLLKTKYAEHCSAQRPFHLAFTDVMNEHSIPAHVWKGLKSAIGSNLANRPRRAHRKSSAKDATTVTVSLMVKAAGRSEIILTKNAGDEAVFRRNAQGEVVNVAHMGSWGKDSMACAMEEARTLFDEQDRDVIQFERLRILEESENHMLILLDGEFEVRIARGKSERVVVKKANRGDVLLTQHQLPTQPLREAKELAKEFFAGVDAKTFTK